MLNLPIHCIAECSWHCRQCLGNRGSVRLAVKPLVLICMVDFLREKNTIPWLISQRISWLIRPAKHSQRRSLAGVSTKLLIHCIVDESFWQDDEEAWLLIYWSLVYTCLPCSAGEVVIRSMVLHIICNLKGWKGRLLTPTSPINTTHRKIARGFCSHSKV